jgi:hypothetical protein
MFGSIQQGCFLDIHGKPYRLVLQPENTDACRRPIPKAVLLEVG